MTTRAEQKLRTRRAILDAALKILSDQRSLDSIGLREVTREAGIAAPSFYRHFADMEELGLALVEEAGLFLRQMLRKTRQRIDDTDSAIDISTDTFIEFLEQYPVHFRILLQEQVGYSDEFRRAVRLEVDNFVNELCDYLQSRATRNIDTQNIAEAMIAIIIAMGAKFTFLDKAKKRALRDNTISQLKLVMLGALKTEI
ncbi:MAG: HTH-type transcriptional repressor FabR [Oleiphilaceae bacterium]|nr:HTH-type transcriptional repressor FabR [Oleiphilaceae bacterium]